MTNKKRLTFETIAIKGSIGYASDYNRNGLFMVDIESGECEYIGLFIGEPLNGRRIHSDAVWVGSRIIFIPGSGSMIDIYYPEINQFESIPIPLPLPRQHHFYMSQFKFIKVFAKEEYLWLIPCTYPGIIRLDLKTNDIEVLNEWIGNDEYFFRMAMLTDKAEVIAANGKSNAVLMFDLDKQFVQIRHLGEHNNGVMNACKEGDNYWFAPRRPGAIVLWKTDVNEIIEYNDFPENFVDGSIVFSYVYSYMDNIIFVPAKSNYGLMINNDEIFISGEISKKFSQSTMEYLFETDTSLYFREISNESEERSFRVLKENNKVEDCEFFYSDNGKRDKELLLHMANNHIVVKENKGFGYMEYIKGLGY